LSRPAFHPICHTFLDAHKHIDSHTDADIDTHVYGDIYTNKHLHPDPDPESDADRNCHAYPDSEFYTDTDSLQHANIYANLYCNRNTDTVQHTHADTIPYSGTLQYTHPYAEQYVHEHIYPDADAEQHTDGHIHTVEYADSNTFIDTHIDLHTDQYANADAFPNERLERDPDLHSPDRRSAANNCRVVIHSHPDDYTLANTDADSVIHTNDYIHSDQHANTDTFPNERPERDSNVGGTDSGSTANNCRVVLHPDSNDYTLANADADSIQYANHHVHAEQHIVEMLVLVVGVAHRLASRREQSDGAGRYE
jgi:hypothetical protein